MKVRIAVFFLMLAWSGLFAAEAVQMATTPAVTAPATSPKPPTLAYAIKKPGQLPLTWGDSLVVTLQHYEALDFSDASKWTVKINGIPVVVSGVTVVEKSRVFQLTLARPPWRTPDNTNGLTAVGLRALTPKYLLGAAKAVLTLEFSGVNLVEDHRPEPAPLTFQAVPRGLAWMFFVLLAFVLVLLVYGYTRTGMLRDADDPAQPIDERPYSLSRVQFAVWFALVTCGTGAIYVLTGEFNHILNQTALALIGISATTAAVVANIAKPPAGVTAPPALQVHEYFLKDILSDSNGPNLHRLQMVAWTLIAMGVFGRTLWLDFTFPTFDEATLFLLGFSSTTYAWFRRDEK